MDQKYVVMVRRHGAISEEILSGPDLFDPMDKAFMPFRLERTHADFESAYLCALNVERDERMTKPIAPIATPKSKLK